MGKARHRIATILGTTTCLALGIAYSVTTPSTRKTAALPAITVSSSLKNEHHQPVQFQHSTPVGIPKTTQPATLEQASQKISHARSTTHTLIPILLHEYLPAFSGLTTENTQVDGAAPILDPYTQRYILIKNILAQSAYTQVDTTVLNAQTRKDLKLFAATPQNQADSLLHTLNHSATVLGEGVTACMLAAPPRNSQVTAQRQACIQSLLHDKKGRQALQTDLHTLQTSLNGLLSLYREDDPLYSQDKTNYFNEWFYSHKKAMRTKPWYIEFQKRFWIDFLD